MQDKHRHPIPTEPTNQGDLSATLRRPHLYLRLEDLFPPLPPSARRRAMAVGLAALTVAAALLLWRWSGSGADTPTDGGGAQGAVPAGSESAESDTLRESEPTANGGAAEADPTDRADETAEPDPNDPVESEPYEPAESDPDGTVESEPYETAESEPSDSVEPEPNESVEPAVTEADDPTARPPAAIPEGCLGVVRADVSETALGVGYMDRNGQTLPASLPTGGLFKTGNGNPTVLIVNTRPYEGYGGGAEWYDPASGGLALTDTPNRPDGVVALGTALARDLRDRGITVIHLRISVSAGETSAAIRARTEEAIRYYCRLYPAIGLVLDLRRSAELTADGSILATEGHYGGTPCAQLRISVSGGRGEEALGCDLAAALALRESLWEEEPTISRPVRVTGGAGIVGDLTDLRILTVEAGSAGNTYAEARLSVEPLGRAIQVLLKNYG